MWHCFWSLALFWCKLLSYWEPHTKFSMHYVCAHSSFRYQLDTESAIFEQSNWFFCIFFCSYQGSGYSSASIFSCPSLNLLQHSNTFTHDMQSFSYASVSNFHGYSVLLKFQVDIFNLLHIFNLFCHYTSAQQKTTKLNEVTEWRSILIFVMQV